jgi:iron complex outermembrane receptor protein
MASVGTRILQLNQSMGESSMSAARCTLLCTLALLAATAPPTRSQTVPDSSTSSDLSKLSIEDLMDVQVTSASAKSQKLSRVAAAIFVISQRDIRRSGATNIPDLLRMVPGLDVAQINGNTWAISSRGFNGQFSNKLLVLVDGRNLYTAAFAGVYWDALDLPLENVDRIEVIRGPGGTIWGSNAVNGVINIFTKKSEETQGLLIEAGAGNIQQGFGTVEYGGKVGEETQYRAYAKYFNDTNLVGSDQESGGDGWHLLSGGFRVDRVLSPKDKLMVEGTIYDGLEGQYAFSQRGVLPQSPLAVHDEVNLNGGSIQAAWSHTYSDRSDSTLQLSFSRYVNGIFERETNNTINVDYKYHISLGSRHDLVAGLGYSNSNDATRGDFAVTFHPSSQSLQVFSAFVQDEIALLPDHLYLTVGSKLEHDYFTGFGVMPSARMAWEPNNSEMLWVAISRALRTPSLADTDVTANVNSFTGPGGMPVLIRYLGDPGFRNESLIAYESGYRASLGDRFSLELALYYNDYDHLQTAEPGTPFFEADPLPPHLVEPLRNANLMHGNTQGGEIWAQWKVTDRWFLSPGYALEQIHMHTSPVSTDMTSAVSLEHNSPRHSAQLRSHVDLAPSFGWDTSAYFVDRLSHQGTFSMSSVPAYTRIDTGLTWRFREALSISAVGQNLVQGRHLEFLGSLGGLQSSELKRSAYVKFVWTMR